MVQMYVESRQPTFSLLPYWKVPESMFAGEVVVYVNENKQEIFVDLISIMLDSCESTW